MSGWVLWHSQLSRAYYARGNRLIYDFTQILGNHGLSERADVIYVRHLVRPRPVFETDVYGLYDAKFPVEQVKRFYVSIFSTDDTERFCADFRRVLQVALVHFVPGGGPLVHEAAEGTPKVLYVFDTDN